MTNTQKVSSVTGEELLWTTWMELFAVPHRQLRKPSLWLKGSCEWENSLESFKASPSHRPLPLHNTQPAFDMEQSRHPWQLGSHYSGRVYPAVRSGSPHLSGLFIDGPSGSLLGTDSISCAVIIKSRSCSHSSAALIVFQWMRRRPLGLASLNGVYAKSQNHWSHFVVFLGPSC